MIETFVGAFMLSVVIHGHAPAGGGLPPVLMHDAVEFGTYKDCINAARIAAQLVPMGKDNLAGGYDIRCVSSVNGETTALWSGGMVTIEGVEK